MQGIGRWIAGIAAVIVLSFIAFFTVMNSESVDPVEIAKRCAASRPEWQNYQEDIKGQIGAAAVAEWHGAPTHLEVREREARLTFHIEGPWSAYACGVPVLLRDPLGNTLQSTAIGPPGDERSYTFTLPTVSPPPWIEIHYPHEERRLPLSLEGEWNAPVEAGAGGR